MKFGGFAPYTYQFFVNNVLTLVDSGIALGSSHIPINKFTITQACRIKIVQSGLTNPVIGVFSKPVTTTDSPEYKSSTG